MTTSRQKEKEERIVRDFLMAAGIPHQALRMREEPDAVVTMESGQEVAVELVEYHQVDMSDKSNNQRRFEEAWRGLNNRIGARVREHARASKLDHIFAYVRFKEAALPPKTDIADMARELVEVMDTHAEEVVKRAEVRLRDFHNHPLANDYVHHIILRDAKAAVRRWWCCGNVQGGTAGLNTSELDRVIKDKSARVPRYKANVGNMPLWLLVHAASCTAATFAPSLWQLQHYAAENDCFLRAAGFNSIWFHSRCGALFDEKDESVRAFRLFPR